eukprot:1182846-Prorocentrum_minimum.AAC.2
MEDDDEHIVAGLQAHPCEQADAKSQPLRYTYDTSTSSNAWAGQPENYLSDPSYLTGQWGGGDAADPIRVADGQRDGDRQADRSGVPGQWGAQRAGDVHGPGRAQLGHRALFRGRRYLTGPSYCHLRAYVPPT